MMELPERIFITEVGPRDGFQSLEKWIETPVKVEIIKRLFAAGVPRMEMVSFISPKAIPQMSDAEQVVICQKAEDMERVIALAASLNGARRAWQAGVKKLTLVISASAAHNQNNVRKTPAQSLEELAEIRREFPEIQIKLSLATAFGCPFQGAVKDSEICYVIDGALACGIEEICLCDTIGAAVPVEVSRLAKMLLSHYQDQPLLWSMHLHNTRGFAAANTMAAMETGIERFETAIAGLGGCPFAPGASGNMATEDLVYLAHRMGIETGIDLSKLLETTEYIGETLKCRIDSRINALTVNLVQCPGKVE